MTNNTSSVPVVSVILPVYNGERYVARCIDRVVRQTYQDWELIIVDDGSTDHTASICDGYASDRIHVIHQKNGGVSAARNAGIAMARGEYLAFVDADDLIEEDYLSTLSSGMDADLIVGGFCYDYAPKPIGGGEI